MKAASGADIPAELFRPIIVHACAEPTTRRQMQQFSAVCRYWASIVRPIMLGNLKLVLKTRESVDDLFSLLDAPSRVSPSFQACMENERGCILTASHQGTWSGVWIRLHSPRLPVTRKCQLVSVSIPPQLATKHREAYYAPRSWYVGLPRTLPHGTIRFSSLSLVGLRFKCIVDVVVLIDEIAGLRELSCSYLTFDDDHRPELPVRIRQRSGSSCGKRFDIARCGSYEDNLFFLHSIVARSSSFGAPGYVLGSEAWSKTLTVLSSLRPKTTKGEATITVFRYKSSQVQTLLFALMSYDVKLHYDFPDPSVDFNQPGTRTVETLEIVYTADRDYSASTTTWSSFCDAVLDLQPVQPTRLCVLRYPNRHDVSEKVFPYFIQTATQSSGALADLYHAGHLEVMYDRILNIRSIHAPKLYRVDGQPVILDPTARFKLFCALLGLPGEALEDAQEDFVRKYEPRVPFLDMNLPIPPLPPTVLAPLWSLPDFAHEGDKGSQFTRLSSVTADVRPLKIPVRPLKIPVRPLKIPVRPPKNPVPSLKTPVRPLKIPVRPPKTPVPSLKTPARPLKIQVHPLETPVRPLKIPVRPLKIPVRPLETPVRPLKIPVRPLKIPARNHKNALRPEA